MRRAGIVLLIFGVAVGLLAAGRPAGAWHGWAHHRHGLTTPRWVPAPFAFFPAALPVSGYRLFHPPGLPLSFQEPSTGTLYCFSQATGFYFVCGYSAPARDAAELPSRPPPRAFPPTGDEAPPAPSGVLLFRLPGHAEASVDGEPVELSRGVGAIAVAPGRHRLVIRVAGRETERTLTIASRAILTITPTAIGPAEP